MTEFTVIEDFPESEIEFHARFSDPKSCYDLLFQHKWPEGFACKMCSQQG
ncbi:MAG: hypothetical protein ABIL58_28265 [Pseudomonadota bacterium]